ncbi:MAG: TolC family protein, partial [Bacteroidota bacterium]
FLLETTEIHNPHIEVALQQASVQKYESILRQKKAAYYPSLNLYYQNNVNWAGDNFLNFSDVNQLPQQIFGLQLNVPIFKGLSTRQSVRQSEWELDLQQQQLANVQLVKQKEDELLQLQWAQASAQLRGSKEILTLQAASDVHVENRYQSGIIGLDDRLNKYNDLLKVQDQYLQSLASLTLSQYKIYIRQIDFQSENR